MSGLLHNVQTSQVAPKTLSVLGMGINWARKYGMFPLESCPPVTRVLNERCFYNLDEYIFLIFMER